MKIWNIFRKPQKTSQKGVEILQHFRLVIKKQLNWKLTEGSVWELNFVVQNEWGKRELLFTRVGASGKMLTPTLEKNLMEFDEVDFVEALEAGAFVVVDTPDQARRREQLAHAM